MNQEKFYGLYPGSLNNNILKKIKEMTEEEIFKLIYSIEDELFWSEHETGIYTNNLKEFEEKNYALDYVIYSTKRFGINFEHPSTKRLEKNEEYLNWYKKWNNLLLKQTLIKKKIKR